MDRQMDPNAFEAALRLLPEGQETAFEIVDLLDDGSEANKRTLRLQRRKLQPELPTPPVRAESPRRRHTFNDAKGLAAYLARYKTENTVILADAANQAISAILDEKAPTGFEVVELCPITHPLFQPWAAHMGTPIPALAFAEFIMLNRRAIVDPDGRELALTVSQIRASTSITLRKGRGVKAVNGLMVETEIQGEREAEAVDLPDTITIRTPLYVGTPAIDLEVDIIAGVADGNEVVFTMGSADVAAARVAAFENMLGELVQLPGVTVALGSPATDEWDYVQPAGA